MKITHFIKAFVLTLLIMGVETGNASFNRKCGKAVKQTKTTTTNKAATTLHFTPLDVVKW